MDFFIFNSQFQGNYPVISEIFIVQYHYKEKQKLFFTSSNIQASYETRKIFKGSSYHLQKPQQSMVLVLPY
ncbi:hypothetical protein jhhlp_000184 [Lomentospora prolificans]|uniref:Uncharacterized protein n=1 Tax=Lomentospora prolificans TaxID=41688 RepID=A0A2N3MYW4_9PEZI|nr:hypothetical protein jhhlp_008223 [Lomentospora prolificans]PKS05377.1 hypothetical protein jhhlp_008752 [Lomentospora prolificans]PKS05516.1 hypothetical protein jhhlp_008207 [Lomentospora prolificans]PKS05703.1 hypothetical protein jhhlp_007971 [Lomentospora prolificans]PKS08206.1 hypothetical protein jhhlp_005482 [Lomentospora prolificans]